MKNFVMALALIISGNVFAQVSCEFYKNGESLENVLVEDPTVPFGGYSAVIDGLRFEVSTPASSIHVSVFDSKNNVWTGAQDMLRYHTASGIYLILCMRD